MGSVDQSTYLPRVSVLGPVEVVTADDVLRPRGLEADLLALLVAHGGRTVSTGRLVDLLWGPAAPPSARNRIQAIVSGLRRTLRPHADLVLTRPPGYALATCGSLDVTEFEARVGQARAAVGRADLPAAAELFRSALSLWRGGPYEGVRATGIAADAVRLEEQRRAVLEEATEVRLQLGQHAEVVVELTGHVAADPLRDRLRGQLMLALYRCGRQAEALEVYQQGAEVLREGHGLEPGEELQRLRQAILTEDPSLRPVEPVDLEVPTDRPVAAQLPADVSGFTGREVHLRLLDSLWPTADGRTGPAVVISALTGLGGVGKSALAVHWAHRVRDQFPDGQLYVNLRGFAAGAPVRPIDALAGFLHALGVVPAAVPAGLEEAAALYRTLLADRRVLIVLDNAREADQVRPLLPGTPGSLVLVTSRDELAGLVAREGAHRVRIDVLPIAESVALLTRLLRPGRPAAEPDSLVELAGLCGGLPLALRIAAANLAVDSHEPVGDYTRRLREGDRLDALAIDGDDETGVRSAFSLSYTALPPAAARMFRLLGLVPGPNITVAAAAALAGRPVDETVTTLDRLARAHLVTRAEPGRYGLHDLLRLFASELTAAEESAAESAAAMDRYIDYHLAHVYGGADQVYPSMLRVTVGPVVARAFDSADEAKQWVDAELPNLTALIRHTAAHGPRAVAWQLVDWLRAYFSLRMLVVPWLEASETALAAARADGNRLGELAAEISVAHACSRTGRHRESVEHLERALELARDEGFVVAEAVLRSNRGVIHSEVGELVEAAQEFRWALALPRPPDALPSRARLLSNLGAVSAWLGDLHTSLRWLTEAYQASDDPLLLADTEANLAPVLLHAGHVTAARDLIAASLRRHREIGHPAGEMEVLRTQGDLRMETGDLDGAMAPLSQALALARRTGRRRGELATISLFGRLLCLTGDIEAATVRLEEGLAGARGIGSRHSECDLLVQLALVRLHTADIDAASDGARQALKIARQYQYRVQEGMAQLVLGEVALAGGDPSAAIDAAQEAVAFLGASGYRVRAADAHALLGRALAADKGPDAGIAHWRRALATYLAVESPRAAVVRDLLAVAGGHQRG